nr:hypothetical protein [uncultured Allomuricauda sp.]
MLRKQSGPLWDNLSAALARTFKKGSTAHIHLTRAAFNNPESTWNRIEKSILLGNKVNIQYHFID